jgi:PKD repeat protein
MRVYPYLLILLLFIGCRKDQMQLAPKACFDIEQNIKIGDTLKFINCSENATTFYWNFGDGFNSTDTSPRHIFENRGNYIVMLIAKNDFSADSVSKSIQVNDPFYTDLHDTIIWVDWANGSLIFNIDIDKDSTVDISVTSYDSYSSSSGSYKYVQIEAMNGYEIAFSNSTVTTWKIIEVDTVIYVNSVSIPMVFIARDTIRTNRSRFRSNKRDILRNTKKY